MPTHEELTRFMRQFKKLPAAVRAAFVAAVEALVEYLRGGFNPTVRRHEPRSIGHITALERTRVSYVQTPAGDVHRAAIPVRDAARDFIGSYRGWIEPHLTEPEL